MTTALEVIAEICGWSYCLIWSSVFIPQVITNFRTRNASGISSQFLVLNMIGYLYYAIFVWFGSYYQVKHDLPRSIVIQDKFFATAATTVIATLAVQTFILFRKTRTDSFHPLVIAVAYTLLLLGVYNLFLGITGKLEWFDDSDSYAFSVLHYFGYAKSFCSLVKQVPQVLLNYTRQHTIGHNMLGPCLDLIGGITSLTQMVIKCFINAHEDGSPNWGYFTSNVPKVFLSVESIFFDTVYLTQTYILYRSNNVRVREEMRLKSLETENTCSSIIEIQDDSHSHSSETTSLDGLSSFAHEEETPSHSVNKSFNPRNEQQPLLPPHDSNTPKYHGSESPV